MQVYTYASRQHFDRQGSTNRDTNCYRRVAI